MIFISLDELPFLCNYDTEKVLILIYFSSSPIKTNKILKILKNHWFEIERTLIDNIWDELTVIISWVKITFLHYPFEINLENSNTFSWITLPNIETLWAMKFYTFWRRWKWKDYVDIYTIIKKWYNFSKISNLAETIFGWAYNEKLLREQLCYFDDIDYSEKVVFLWKGNNDDKIKDFLIELVKR